jgi:hypothetical protein
MENRDAADPLIINPEETSGEKSDSDDWPVTSEYIL